MFKAYTDALEGSEQLCDSLFCWLQGTLCQVAASAAEGSCNDDSCGGLSWTAVSLLASVLSEPCLEGAMQRYTAQQGHCAGALSLLRAAAELTAHALLNWKPGTPLRACLGSQLELLKLLYAVDKQLFLPLHEDSKAGRLGCTVEEYGQLRRDSLQALLPILPRLERALWQVALQQQLEPAAAAEDAGQTATALCHAWWPIVDFTAATCEASRPPFEGVGEMQLCSVATAALRAIALLPAAVVLAQQQAGMAQVSLDLPTELATALAGLAAATSDPAACRHPQALAEAARAAGPAAWQAAVQALHQTCCRAVHFCASSQALPLLAQLDHDRQCKLHEELLIASCAAFWLARNGNPSEQPR